MLRMHAAQPVAGYMYSAVTSRLFTPNLFDPLARQRAAEIQFPSRLVPIVGSCGFLSMLDLSVAERVYFLLCVLSPSAEAPKLCRQGRDTLVTRG